MLATTSKDFHISPTNIETLDNSEEKYFPNLQLYIEDMLPMIRMLYMLNVLYGSTHLKLWPLSWSAQIYRQDTLPPSSPTLHLHLHLHLSLSL